MLGEGCFLVFIYFLLGKYYVIRRKYILLNKGKNGPASRTFPPLLLLIEPGHFPMFSKLIFQSPECVEIIKYMNTGK